jgi:Cys-tRNA(Pro)/Cys-tRNA(Cys) deacylase
VKTNACRACSNRSAFGYELREYQVDPDDLAAETVAAKIGLPPEQVFKTLVMRGDRNGVCLAVVAGQRRGRRESALARLTGDRRIEMVPLKEVQGLTGYIRGGVTALAAKARFSGVCRRDGGAVRCDLHLRGRPGHADPDRTV